MCRTPDSSAAAGHRPLSVSDAANGGSRPTVSVIIPALNEAANLEELLPRLPEVDEVVLVDGGSVDGTVEVALEVRPDIVVIEQTRRGKGNAMACGFRAATGDIVVMLDADGSADPAEIPRFVETLCAGADFAKGTRFAGDGGSDDISLLRKLGNAGLQFVFNQTFGRHFSDLCYGYNAFWTSLVPVLDLPGRHVTASADEMVWGDGFEIEALITCRMVKAGVDIVEVPSVEHERLHGESHLRTFSDGFRVLRTILVEKRRAATGAHQAVPLSVVGEQPPTPRHAPARAHASRSARAGARTAGSR